MPDERRYRIDTCGANPPTPRAEARRRFDIGGRVPQEARQLLLTALRVGATYDLVESSPPVTPDTWEEVVRQARQHGVAPLLYWQLRESRSAVVPPSILRTLRLDYLANANANARLFEQVAPVLSALHEAGVLVIALKGAALAHVVYPNIAVRPMNDIDLLVQERDLARTDKLLRDLGLARQYELHEPIEEIHHFVYLQPASRLTLEVHWDLASPVYGIRVDVAGLWQRPQPASIFGTPVLTLAPKDQLLHLGLHSALHTLDMGVRGICDIAWIIDRYQSVIDWRDLAECASTWGIGRALYTVLWLARELLGAPVAQDTLAALRPPPADDHYTRLAKEHLFASVEESERALPSSATLVDIWAEKTVAGKFAQLLNSFFPARQVMSTMFPVPPRSPRIYLCYPLRWIDLLKRYGKLAWSLARHDEETIARARRQSQINGLRDWLLSG